MTMKKILAVLLFVLICSTGIFAETISEKKFSELGFQEFTAEQANTEACRELEFFLSPQDLNAGNYTIVSVHAEFLPIDAGKAAVSLELGEFIKILERKDFVQGYARITLPKDKLAESNKFTLCGKSFDTITKVKLLDDSLVGTYKTFDFSKDDSFTIKTLGEPFKNEPLKVEITVKNYGSLPADVKVKHWAWTMPAVELVSTDTEFLARIPEFNYETLSPGQKTFNYTIFPKASIAMSLPPAVLEYDNIFGESQSMRSNQISFEAKETAKELTAEIVSSNEINETGAPVQAKVLVKNPLEKELTNITVKLFSDDKEVLLNETEKTIPLIRGKEEKELLFELSTKKTGKTTLKCLVSYTNVENIEVPCAEQAVFFGEPKFDPTLLVIIILALAGLVVFFVLSMPQSENANLGIAEVAPEEKKGPFGRKFTEPKKDKK